MSQSSLIGLPCKLNLQLNLLPVKDEQKDSRKYQDSFPSVTCPLDPNITNRLEFLKVIRIKTCHSAYWVRLSWWLNSPNCRLANFKGKISSLKLQDTIQDVEDTKQSLSLTSEYVISFLSIHCFILFHISSYPLSAGPLSYGPSIVWTP